MIDSPPPILEFQRKTSGSKLFGALRVPGDKSITHRAILFGAIAEGDTRLRTTLLGRDNFASLRIVEQLGVTVSGTLTQEAAVLAEQEGLRSLSGRGSVCDIVVSGKGFDALKPPKGKLDCGNSGTTARLLCGILAGRPFRSELCGDGSLSKRPFRRVAEPLTNMGAHFSREMLPFVLEGANLHGIDYQSPKASAQVKSAILLAGLQSNERVAVREPWKSRDHTERMLSDMGCELLQREHADGSFEVILERGAYRTLQGRVIDVPGDFSSAAFFLVAASLCEGSEVLLQHICVNPTRTGLFHLLLRMGANIVLENERLVGGEDVADLRVRSAELRGITVDARDVVAAIDEVPIFCIAAACARGVTEIRGAEELRVKESDRLTMMAEILKAAGIRVEELADGLIIYGQENRSRLTCPSASSNSVPWAGCHDHRIYMSAAVMDLVISGGFRLGGLDAVETSFPGFIECFQKLTCA